MAEKNLWKAIGPGLLFAGAAIGVSHLVQSTRAGAVYGFALVGLVILANLAKYPAFRFGPQYAAATGTSLLEGYRRQGRFALVIYLLLTLGTMFTVQAAVALVCAGLFKVMLGLSTPAPVLAIALMAVCALLLAVGRFKALDGVNKLIVAVMTVSTVIATALAVPQVDWGAMRFWPTGDQFSVADIAFYAALVGWMPSAIDIAVWNSLWTLARKEATGHQPSVRESLFDFNLGYWGTAILALCFVTLGAAVMHGRGVAFADGAGGFAAQVIDLYVANLGEWARPVISICAFAVMFSTTLTVVDGFPRALAVLWQRFRGPEAPWQAEEAAPTFRRAYWASLAVLAVGTGVVLQVLLTSLKQFVDLATILSFLTAPVLAWLNHRAIHAPEVPAEHRPSTALRLGSLAGLLFLGGFALYYLWLRLA
ncbi:MAG: divalent metal cation transporter [Myxococcales bacterium]|nr:divalent metal cation transporter [Myxococcales bacterium]